MVRLPSSSKKLSHTFSPVPLSDSLFLASAWTLRAREPECFFVTCPMELYLTFSLELTIIQLSSQLKLQFKTMLYLQVLTMVFAPRILGQNRPWKHTAGMWSKLAQSENVCRASQNDWKEGQGQNYLKARKLPGLPHWGTTWENIADIMAMAWYTDLAVPPWLPDGYLTDLT